MNRELIRLEEEIEFEIPEPRQVDLQILKEILVEMEMSKSWEEAQICLLLCKIRGIIIRLFYDSIIKLWSAKRQFRRFYD